MTLPSLPNQLTFQGEVIEIVEGKEAKMMKISLWPCTIDLPLEMSEEPHLGDFVTVNASLLITGVEPAIFFD